jgi:hypothetical protein
MNICLPRILCLLMVAAVLNGCSDAKVQVHVEPIDFQGLKVTLPNNGMGKFGVTPDSLYWSHDAIVIYIKNIGDGEFEIRKNPIVKHLGNNAEELQSSGDLLGKAKKGEHIRFSEDGREFTKGE